MKLDWIRLVYGRAGATALPDDVTRTTWARFFDPHEPVNAWVAETDGRLVGFTHYIFHRSTTMKTYTCYLQDLFTDKSIRGQGIGRALISAVYDQAKTAGISRVYWQTHESNHVAMKLYDQVAERSGFLIYRKDVV